MTYAREAGHSVRTQAYVLVLSFIMGILVARALGASQRGVLALAQQLFSIAVLVGALGFDAGLRYHVARWPDAKPRTLGAGSSLLLLGLILTISLYALGYLTFRTGIFSSLPTSVVLLFGVVIPMNMINAYLGAVIYGDGHIIAVNQAQFISTSTRLVLIAILLIMGLTIEGVIAATLGMELASFVCLFWHYRSRIGPLRFGLDLEKAGAILGYGVKAMGSGLVQWANFRFDVFLVAAMCQTADVGRYSVAVMISEVLMKTSGAVVRPLFPRVAREMLAPAMTATASRSNLLLMILLGPLILIPAYLAHLYLGREFAGMLAAFVCLLPGTIAAGVSYVLHSDLAARGAIGRSLVVNLASLAVNIGLNLLLIPRYGILGAAIASTVAYLLNAVLASAFFSAMHHLPMRELWLVGSADIGAMRDRFREFLHGLVRF